MALLSELASRAALALANARLYQQAQRAEALAERAHQRVRTILESVPQISWVHTVNGGVEFLSRQWFEYTGLVPTVRESQISTVC